MRRLARSAYLIAAIASSAPAARAETLVLDCTRPEQVQKYGTHQLIEIDLGARMVRDHVVTGDGAPARLNGVPYADYTEPAEVSDAAVRWRHYIGNTAEGRRCFHQEEVGRYTGMYEMQMGCVSGPPIRVQCRQSEIGRGKKLF